MNTAIQTARSAWRIFERWARVLREAVTLALPAGTELTLPRIGAVVVVGFADAQVDCIVCRDSAGRSRAVLVSTALDAAECRTHGFPAVRAGMEAFSEQSLAKPSSAGYGNAGPLDAAPPLGSRVG